MVLGGSVCGPAGLNGFIRICRACPGTPVGPATVPTLDCMIGCLGELIDAINPRFHQLIYGGGIPKENKQSVVNIRARERRISLDESLVQAIVTVYVF